VFKQSKWYVYAFCRERNAFRLFKVSRIVSYKIIEEQFQLRSVEKIKFGRNYGIELFSSQNQAELFEVILEYDVSDEFALADKIDASFFKRAINGKADCGQIRFQVSNLAWAADQVFSLLDKVRVISPHALQEEIKCRLDKINSRYKGDI
jgi:predicted DNA-binding transcriptional regulator YafY